MPEKLNDQLPWDEWSHQRIRINDDGLSVHLRYAGCGSPLILVHGNPQHSLTWHTAGPILAKRFTVIAPDNRGAGDSTIPHDDDYNAETHADDLNAILEFFKLKAVYIFSHDKGSGFAAAFAAKYPQKVRRVGFSEYALPGFGYEMSWVPSSGGGIGWDLYKNWQLGFFSVPEAASFFINGREKQMLRWYFFHSSYSGNESISQDHLTRYAGNIGRPAFLRAMLNVFSVKTVTNDNAFFKRTIGQRKLAMPVLVLGGEASMGRKALQAVWGPTAETPIIDVVPKAGHWIADENPIWVAKRIESFLDEDRDPLPDADLSWLKDKVTLE